MEIWCKHFFLGLRHVKLNSFYLEFNVPWNPASSDFSFVLVYSVLQCTSHVESLISTFYSYRCVIQYPILAIRSSQISTLSLIPQNIILGDLTKSNLSQQNWYRDIVFYGACECARGCLGSFSRCSISLQIQCQAVLMCQRVPVCPIVAKLHWFGILPVMLFSRSNLLESTQAE